MRCARTILFSAAFMGVECFILWIYSNSLFPINQVGLLERQPWPINDIFSFAGLGAVFGLLIGIQRFRRERAHSIQVADLCSHMGFSYLLFAKEEPWKSLPVCERWLAGFDEMAGTLGGRAFRMVDMQTHMLSRGSLVYDRKTIAAVEIHGLPDFQLVPRSFSLRALALTGFRGVTFERKEGQNQEIRTLHEEFERAFQLIPLSAAFSLSALGSASTLKKIESEESKLRQRFAPPLMSLLLRYPWYSLQAKGGRLAIWRGERCLAAEARPQFLQEIEDLCDGLAASVVHDNQGGTPPELGQGRLTFQVKRFWATVHGGIGGLFAGFFSGFSFSIYIQHFHPAIKRGFLAAGLGFFECVILGAILGSAAGAVLGNQGFLEFGKARPKTPAKS